MRWLALFLYYMGIVCFIIAMSEQTLFDMAVRIAMGLALTTGGHLIDRIPAKKKESKHG